MMTFDLNTASKNTYSLDVNTQGQIVYCTEQI
jgi:hypothetical protein